MHHQLWGYKVEEKLYVGVREQKKVEYRWSRSLTTTTTTTGKQTQLTQSDAPTLSRYSATAESIYGRLNLQHA
jgi:hypothetical protein